MSKDRNSPRHELEFLLALTSTRVRHSGGRIEHIPHTGRWDALLAVYKGAASSFGLF